MQPGMTARVRIPIGVDEENTLGYQRMVEAIERNENLRGALVDILLASRSLDSECFLRAADPLIDSIQSAKSPTRSFSSSDADLNRFLSLGAHGMRVELRKNLRGLAVDKGLMQVMQAADLVELLQRSHGVRFRFRKAGSNV